MSRKSDPFTEVFNLIKGKTNTIDGDFSIENIQNLLNNETTMNLMLNIAPQMASHLLTSEILQKILDTNPELTNELMTEQINLFEKDHPESKEIINKYLRLYEENYSNKRIYNIRMFVKSDQCKKALEDPQIKLYLKEILNSSDFKEKIKQFKKK
ncbi:hypothetical protein I4U23_027710 [Adineta vaga]|nr:hypothetical protein I4U23_027710 [Adineta vaga]